jgi:hypothetical protein
MSPTGLANAWSNAHDIGDNVRSSSDQAGVNSDDNGLWFGSAEKPSMSSLIEAGPAASLGPCWWFVLIGSAELSEELRPCHDPSEQPI